jgi:hypothetical protein
MEEGVSVALFFIFTPKSPTGDFQIYRHLQLGLLKKSFLTAKHAK